MPRPSNTIVRRATIIRAFHDLAGDQFIYQITTKMIAEKAELSQGLIHYHFESIEVIRHAWAVHFLSRPPEPEYRGWRRRQIQLQALVVYDDGIALVLANHLAQTSQVPVNTDHWSPMALSEVARLYPDLAAEWNINPEVLR